MAGGGDIDIVAWRAERPVLRWMLAAIAAVAVQCAPLLLAPAPARAETLAEALQSAYRTNPQLDAERARLRATDEEVPRAIAGYRPTLSGSADTGYQYLKTKPRSRTNGVTRPRGYSISASQSLFRGFRVVNTVRTAEANVRAGREVLRTTEQTVLLAAVQAYVDVIRDQALVRLRENNVKVLSKELRATKDRFKVGEVTRTDVAQARARRAGGVSALDLARANLQSSRATYERVIGHKPHRLRAPPPHSRLRPPSVNEAVETAITQSPSVVQALYLEQAARHNVATIRGELLPTAQLDASYTKRFEPSRLIQESETTTVMGTLNFPFYQGGEVMSRVRQAKHTHVSRLQEIQRFRTEARETAVSAWSQLVAARAAVVSDRSAVNANRIALDGVREEERVGQRTLLDVLNAQQELLDSQVTLVIDQRNEVLASYNLIASIGRLSADELNVADTIYDPDQHYHEVRRRWWGISITHRDGRHEQVDLWDSHGRDHSMK